MLLHHRNRYSFLPRTNSVKVLLDALKYEGYIWLGGYQRFQNGDFPDGSPRRLYNVSILYLPLEQHGLCTQPQVGLARADGVQCEEEQRQMEANMDTWKIFFPPLHLKLDLMKQFVTALDKGSAALKYLQYFFPK